MKESDRIKVLMTVCLLLSASCVRVSVEANESDIFSQNLTLQQQDDNSPDTSTDTQTSREKKK